MKVQLSTLMAALLCLQLGCENPHLLSSSHSIVTTPNPAHKPHRNDENQRQSHKTKEELPAVIIPTLLTHETSGNFSYEIEPNNRVVRFKKNAQVLSRKQFIEALADHTPGADSLRRLINKAVNVFAVQGQNAIKLKSPPISNATKDEAFFWLAQPHTFNRQDIENTYKHYLIHCNDGLSGGDNKNTDYRTRFLGIIDNIGSHLKNTLMVNSLFSNASVFFINSGSSPDRLVIPCPFDKDFRSEKNKVLLNIGSYTHFLENDPTANNLERINSYWLALGIAAQDSFQQNNQPLYLHTHGTGTRYVHFRVDVNAYDYSDGAAQKIVREPTASQFYRQVFGNN